jgi:hypothetical protein
MDIPLPACDPDRYAYSFLLIQLLFCNSLASSPQRHNMAAKEQSFEELMAELDAEASSSDAKPAPKLKSDLSGASLDVDFDDSPSAQSVRCIRCDYDVSSDVKILRFGAVAPPVLFSL